MRKVEEFARMVIEQELGQPVVVHDDGSENSMYDLRIGPKEAPKIAIECVGAVNSKFVESWKIGPGKGSVVFDGLKNDWLVELRVGARIKKFWQEIEGLLTRLETVGILHMNEYREWRQHEDLMEELERVGVTSAHVVDRNDPRGKVLLTLPGIGGGVDDEGSKIPTWIAEFLNDDTKADVLHKLKISGAEKCHVFVPISFSGAPFAVESYFSGDLNKLPQDAPDLPSPVDCVWICGMGVNGLWWDGAEWKFFSCA